VRKRREQQRSRRGGVPGEERGSACGIMPLSMCKSCMTRCSQLKRQVRSMDSEGVRGVAAPRERVNVLYDSFQAESRRCTKFIIASRSDHKNKPYGASSLL
jgi:hypothetical protein